MQKESMMQEKKIEEKEDLERAKNDSETEKTT